MMMGNYSDQQDRKPMDFLCGPPQALSSTGNSRHHCLGLLNNHFNNYNEVFSYKIDRHVMYWQSKMYRE